MNHSKTHSGRHALGGTIKVFLAELLIVPSGLLTAVYLTRKLGPEDYGAFALAITLIIWIQWSITSLLSRATIKLISEADDWKPIGKTVLRLNLAISVIAALLLCVLAGPIAALLAEPIIASYLRLFAIDIPLFALAHAHRNILVGLGGFAQRAMASAGRWTARVVLIVVLVHVGLGVYGAIIGSMLASLVELVLYRVFVRPPLWGPTTFSARRLWGYAVPLFLFVLSLHLFNKMDLMALKVLGGKIEQVGFFEAAQNLALLPSIVAAALTPLLLATLSRKLSLGDTETAHLMASKAKRAILCLLPFAAMMAGAAPEIVTFFFGQRFEPAAPLVAILAFAAVARALIAVDTTILTAAGKSTWTFALAGPMVPAAILGHVLVIPTYGPRGAATVTLVVACLAVLAGTIVVRQLWRIAPPLVTLLRCALVGALAFAPAATWVTPGPLLLVKLGVIAVLIVIVLFVLGEFGADDIELVRSVLWRPKARVNNSSKT